MAAPRKYPDELRERATRLAIEARKDPAGRAGAIKRVADQLDVHPEALRGWVKRAETDEGIVPGTSSTDAARIAELEREVKELRRANAILKSASAFFAAELCATRRDVDREVVKDHFRRAVVAA
ncbi:MULTISPECIES: transposase [unclassified Streptomyces]|uniref:transposase n=1 Tax=unclassified Streptomyces TaxID=2593676 RepID=UPI002255171B|nr:MULTISPECIES: transposase [unclassified Streptomyces]MCX4538171.1 transposase [Streptomyces sp. NBC_01669]WSA05788.1 transposase [Streptomyces sp. NBC_00841]